MSAGSARPIAIVTALPEELEPLVRRAGTIRRFRRGEHRFYTALLGGIPVAMMSSGDGGRNARSGAKALLESVEPSVLIGAGVAGGLSPGLALGQLLAARELRDTSGPAGASDAEWLARAVHRGALAATLVTVGNVIPSAAAKAALLDSLALPDGAAAAVDMESAEWARAAGEAGVPFLGLRAIYERAEDDLPEFLAECQGADGAVSRMKVALHAATHPAVTGELMRMRKRLLETSQVLAEFVEGLLAAGI